MAEQEIIHKLPFSNPPQVKQFSRTGHLGASLALVVVFLTQHFFLALK